MAIGNKKMSKSNHRVLSSDIELLFVNDRGVQQLRPRTGMHDHVFWQLEFVTAGRLGVMDADVRYDLDPGGLMLAAPGVRHGFIYDDPRVQWVTLKFHADCQPLPGLVIEQSQGPMAMALGTLAEMPIREVLDDPGWRLWVEGVLAHVLSLLGRSGGSRVGQGGVCQRIDRLVRSRPDRMQTAAAVAAALGYTPQHVGKLVRREGGSGLKQQIDGARAAVACRLLYYSDRSIGDIAAMLGFSDLYRFSRFFKRVVGVSPRTWRCAPELTMLDRT